MRKYACKDGDYGLAVEPHGRDIKPVKRYEGEWLYLYHEDDGPYCGLAGPDDEATIYRLTGWGADGPTEMWTEPKEPSNA